MTGSMRDQQSPLNSNEDEHESAAKFQLRTILAAVIASLITTLIILVIFTVSDGYWNITNNNNIHTKNDTNSHNTRYLEEWIFLNRSYGNVTIYESAVINEEDGTALVIAGDAYKLDNTNSLLLYDFQQGFLALRDTRTCNVTKTPFPDVSYAKKMIEEGRLFGNSTGKPLRLEHRRCVLQSAMPLPELGQKLTGFCKGVNTNWVDGIFSEDDPHCAATLLSTEDSVEKTVDGLLPPVTLRKRPMQRRKKKYTFLPQFEGMDYKISAEPNFTKAVFSMSMCTRQCGKELSHCGLVNFNKHTGECRGYISENVILTKEKTNDPWKISQNTLV